MNFDSSSTSICFEVHMNSMFYGKKEQKKWSISVTADFLKPTNHILLTYKKKIHCPFIPKNLWLKPKDYNFLKNSPCSQKFKLGDECLTEYIQITY